MFNAYALLTALALSPTHVSDSHHPAVVAGIDLGGKGAKGVVLGQPLDGAPRVLWSKSLEPTPLANLSPDGRMTDDAIRRTAGAVAELVRVIQTEFELPDSRIHVVASSGVAAVTNRAALADAVRRETRLVVQFLTPEDEAALVHRGVVPAVERHTAMVIDIGSGNTRVAAAGWSNGIGEWRVGGTVDAGTITLTNRATAAAGASGRWADGLASERTELARQIAALANWHPTLVYYRPKCYLTGGVAWAVATATKPGAVRDPFVALSAADIERFEELLAAHLDEMPPVDFGAIADSTVRAEAEGEWRRVKDTFNPKNLRAGCAILRELAVAYRLDRKEVVFARGGQFAWLTALLASEAEPPAPVSGGVTPPAMRVWITAPRRAVCPPLIRRPMYR